MVNLIGSSTFLTQLRKEKVLNLRTLLFRLSIFGAKIAKFACFTRTNLRILQQKIGFLSKLFFEISVSRAMVSYLINILRVEVLGSAELGSAVHRHSHYTKKILGQSWGRLFEAHLALTWDKSNLNHTSI